MTRARLTLFDTTLRDGAQTNGVDFSVEDKVLIAGLLDELGLDYVEGGYPGANPTDTRFFSEKRTERARFTAFGMTKRAGVSLSNDPGVNTLLAAQSDAVCFVAKSWDHQVKVALGATLEENLEGIRQSVAAAIAAGKEALVDCEHFFDGYKANPDYAIACARTAYEAGARWIVLCDTNGGSQPAEVEAIVRAVSVDVPGSHLGIHAHNDTEQAVANSLAAVRGGARQIQGTLNGIGERCGNANLTSIIPTLLLKPIYAQAYEIGVTLEALKGLTALSRRFDEIVNRAPNRQAPYVGASAFATKAGIHASAIAKETSSYEHVEPESVGNHRRVLVSDQAGRSNLLAELARLGIPVDKSDRRLDMLLAEVKEREAIGYSYEGADASFELLARRTLGNVPDFFTVESFHVTVERRLNALGKMVSVSEAVVKLIVGGERLLTVAEGNGPVNALDRALRKDLGVYQDVIADLELVDYKVRILNGGTEAVTRVLIESRDSSGDSWSTIGVSENVVDASFEALIDSIVYTLIRKGVAPN
ncbi:citramalate synthase [Kaistia dalseonensis]|uniref:Citramalate synthase n=1 Tax=Kaistia dalseonensis TaxID=410840 RepID=A0ABU0H224_9HYPH|nr:citramalate synthase [Kaistia dalseonensis]MCX5493794.1 citramalate synthase [Kaistia dalseonensis]MDQ0436359.1 2-isopropylmalate synthase [Kaistia dalseonensis]